MSRHQYPSQLHDQSGNVVRLATKPFAIGGEGAVFDVLNNPDVVAKLYNKLQSRERCDKLRAMAKLCSPDLLKIAAWPTATLNAGNPATIDGILMPRIADFLEIHHLYSVAQRKKDFPEADWGFLLHTAKNCAIAFESVHSHGHVVGDVNQKNVMVSRKGIVALVDCDSFQVAEGTRIFRCGVGVPEYTPPELQGKSFATLDRTANHDLFGLAILVFHLLMMGRHPFSGVPLVQADIPIEKAIAEGYYAYTRNTSSARLKPPPHVPPVTMLDPSMLDLFERAFTTAQRPTATDWRGVLDKAMSQLIRCKNDPRHSYLTAAGGCPWCGMIATSRLMFFLPKSGATTNFRPEDLQNLLNKLAQLQLTFDAYTRPKATQPVKGSVAPGVKAIVPKPLVKTHPPAPVPIPKPTLADLPLPPQLHRASFKPHPVPPLIPLAPALKPHPPRPDEPPRPKFNTIPLPPVHPPEPSPSPPDPFLNRVSFAGMLVGTVLFFIARPVGVLLVIVFGFWWLLLIMTADTRQKRSIAAGKRAHQNECDQLDAEYEDLCAPIEEANQQMKAAWNATKDALAARYQRACKRVDAENLATLAPWEALKSAIEEEHRQKCQEIDQENRDQKAKVDIANATLTAEHDRQFKEIQTANRRLMEDWGAKTAARNEAHAKACRDIDDHNRRMLSAWEAMNAPWLDEEKRLKHQLASAQDEINRLEAALFDQRKTIGEQFERKKRDADASFASHTKVRQQYQSDLREAEQDSKRIQMDQHLDSFLIRQAKLKGITTERVFLALESFGIQTANDVDILRTTKVPNIGPVLRDRLLDWKNSVASKFVLKLALPESERNRIASRYAPVFLPLIQSVEVAIRDIEGFAASERARDRERVKAIGVVVQMATNVAADLDALNRLV
jgi:DNA-binding helix-hairpin-helix protein with protein kinase domain